MNAIVQFNKKKYETPLEMLHRIRMEHPELAQEKLSYLGRLDPLAHGVMFVAVGEANKDREKYLGLSKTYRVKFLFGISTDTGDVLGLVQDVQKESGDIEQIQKHILNLKGKHMLPYPMYSSKTVAGKPLHEYAREGTVVVLPEREMEVLSVTYGDTHIILGKEIAEEGIEAAEKVRGDFRQEKIKHSWENFLKQYGEEKFTVLTAKLSVTSGTYIRSLAVFLSEKTGLPCLACDIERTKIHV